MSVGSGTVSSPVGDASDEGFFGTITQGLAQGAAELLSQAVPVWAASQVGLQKTDQMNQPLYVYDPNNPRNNDGIKSTSSGGFWATLTGQSATTKKGSANQSAYGGVTVAGIPLPIVLGIATVGALALLYVSLRK